jgi:ATP-binding cassette subfamily B protein
VKSDYLNDLIRIVKPYKTSLIIGLASTIFASALDVASPMLLKFGIDGLQDHNNLGWLMTIAGLILLAAGVSGIFRYFMRMRVIGISRSVESDIRDGFFKHLIGLSPTFFDNNHTGDLMTRATEDVERVRMLVGPALMYSVSTILIISFSGIMMFYLDPVLSGWVLLLAPMIGTVVFLIARKLHKANLLQQEAYSELTNKVQENLSGIRVIKAYSREDYELERFTQHCETYFDRSLLVVKAQAMFMPFLGLLVGLGIAGILWVGGHRMADGNLTLGSFIAFISYLSLMTWPMIALGWVTHLYQRGSASQKRLDYIHATEPQFESNSSDHNSANGTSEPVIEHAPKITFKNLEMSYKNGKAPALSGINLTIPAGSVTAIVGSVGSGKSTLARLLPRLYEADSGEVLIDELPLESYGIESLRRSIGYVDQTAFLFSATIKHNISIGLPDTSQEDIVQAVRTACFEEEIETFPDQYETRIGERGVTLSGGQRQRLTLARALLMDTPILVLDDSLSAVDSDTEAEIISKLKTRMSGQTVLFITHRLAAAESADNIIVLDEGKLIESGNHDSLLADGGLYAEMFKRQRLAEELEVME